MKLRYVTFTGAGDDTPVKEMIEISLDYPMVEWGILLSEQSMGAKSRFPSRAWMGSLAAHLELLGVPINLSGHLCGSWMRRLISLGITEEAKAAVGPLWDYFKRMQINFVGWEDLVTPFMANALDDDIEWILQNRNNDFVMPLLEKYPKMQTLFDTSGGRGKLPEFPWLPHYSRTFTGYAGGLNPDNIVEQLKRISEVTKKDTEIWIDMESGVRTNEKFDLQKVKQVLHNIKDFL
jgi:hypothetical protein